MHAGSVLVLMMLDLLTDNDMSKSTGGFLEKKWPSTVQRYLQRATDV